MSEERIQFSDQPPLDATTFLADIDAMMKEMRSVTGISDALRPRPIDTDGRMDWFYPHEVGIEVDPRPSFSTIQISRPAAPLGEMQIIENEFMTVAAEDWSRVRSPSRARRRMSLGHRQNVRYYQAPDPTLLYTDDTIVGHPETLKRVFEAARAEVREHADRMVLNALYGRV